MTGESPGGGQSGGPSGGPSPAEPEGPGIELRIRDGYDSLTATEKRAADFITGHLPDLAVYSATEIAERSGVSKATVSRLFRRLGYADAQEVRGHARALRGRGIPAPVGTAGDLSEQLHRERDALDVMVAALSDGRLDRAASRIASAREVVVIGFRSAYPVALHLRQQLAHARPRVRIAPAPGQSVGEEIAALDGRDVVVLVGIRRRPRGFGALTATLQARGVPLVVVADPGLRLVSSETTLVLPAPVDTGASFDSYAAPMSLVAFLASAVLEAGEAAGRARIDGITRLYAELGELE